MAWSLLGDLPGGAPQSFIGCCATDDIAYVLYVVNHAYQFASVTTAGVVTALTPPPSSNDGVGLAVTADGATVFMPGYNSASPPMTYSVADDTWSPLPVPSPNNGAADPTMVGSTYAFRAGSTIPYMAAGGGAWSIMGSPSGYTINSVAGTLSAYPGQVIFLNYDNPEWGAYAVAPGGNAVTRVTELGTTQSSLTRCAGDIIFMPLGASGSTVQDAQIYRVSSAAFTSTPLPANYANASTCCAVSPGGRLWITGLDKSGTLSADVLTYVPPAALAGASTAALGVAGAGAGTVTDTPAAAAVATVHTVGAGAGLGNETAEGAAIAAVTVTAAGQGSGAGHAAGASGTAVTIASTGAGQAVEILAGAAVATVAVAVAGAGVIAAGISGAVQDFPDWVPPHVVIATDNVIYASAPGGDALPFRPTFVGLGGWASVILTLAALPVEVLAALSVIMEWTSAGSVIATRVIDLVAGTDAADTVAGVQVATVARSDELRVTIPAAAGVGRVLLTLAATTRAIGEAVTPATFPGSAQYAAGPAAGSVPAAGHLDLYAGPYQSGSRLVLAPAAALTVTASRLDVTAGGYTPYDAASWSVTDTAGGPLYLPAPAGVTRWRLTNAAGAPVSVDYYVEGVST